MIIISGKKYDRVIEAHIVTDGACYIVYDDENFEKKKLNFKFDEIEEWNIKLN